MLYLKGKGTVHVSKPVLPFTRVNQSWRLYPECHKRLGPGFKNRIYRGHKTADQNPIARQRPHFPRLPATYSA